MKFGSGGCDPCCYVDRDGDLTVSSGLGAGTVFIARESWSEVLAWLSKPKGGPLFSDPDGHLWVKVKWREDGSLLLEQAFDDPPGPPPFSWGLVILAPVEAYELRAFLDVVSREHV